MTAMRESFEVGFPRAWCMAAVSCFSIVAPRVLSNLELSIKQKSNCANLISVLHLELGLSTMPLHRVERSEWRGHSLHNDMESCSLVHKTIKAVLARLDSILLFQHPPGQRVLYAGLRFDCTGGQSRREASASGAGVRLYTLIS